MSGGGQQAPQGYQPAGQPQADAGFLGGANQLSTAGSSLYSSVAPQLATAASNVQNNPYFPQAMTGAQNTANVANTQVAPQQLSSSQNISNLSTLAGQAIPGLTAPGMQAAGQVLQTGFDPQQQLYNRTLQQTQDQQNAINSMYGVSSSPYGAGVAGQTSANFNIDWQNQQLARQLQALGGWNSTASGAAGNIATLTGTAGNAATTASDLGTAGLNTMAGASQLPYDLYQNQQGAGLNALGQQIQGTVGSLAPTQQATGDFGSYLNIGQGATANAQNAVKQNNAQANAMWGGIGSLFGDVAGMAMFA